MTPDFFMYFLCLKLSTVSSKLRLQLIQILCFIYSYISDRIFLFCGDLRSPSGALCWMQPWLVSIETDIFKGMKYWLTLTLLLAGCSGFQLPKCEQPSFGCKAATSSSLVYREPIIVADQIAAILTRIS